MTGGDRDPDRRNRGGDRLRRAGLERRLHAGPRVLSRPIPEIFQCQCQWTESPWSPPEQVAAQSAEVPARPTPEILQRTESLWSRLALALRAEA